MIKKSAYTIFITLLMFLSIMSGAHAQPLPSEQVFSVKAEIVDSNNIALTWDTKDGYFLYRERIHFSNANQETLALGKYNLPEGEKKLDPNTQQEYEIYRGQIRIVLSILGHKAGAGKILVDYQGCSDGGFCYPPLRKELLLNINDDLAPTETTLLDAKIPSSNTETSQAEQVLESESLLLILFSFYGFGLLLAFTPCILPMIPILSGIIVGQKKKITTAHAFCLSLIYVLSMSLTYALIGMSIALLGSNIQAALQTPLVLTLTSALFVALALSMFGYYELNLPQSWRAALTNVSQHQKGGTYLGVAFMGCLSTLVLSPCITPPLVGVLSFIAHSGDALMGAVALFTLSLGMGTPLLLIGTAGGNILPKAGPWMVSVQRVFGFIFLILAIYVLDRVLPNSVIVILWALLLITTGIYLGALSRTKTTSFMDTLSRGVAIVFLVYGAVLIVAMGMDDDKVLQPLAEFSIVHAPQQGVIQAINISSIDEFKQTLAANKGKPTFVDFHAKWCASCAVFDRKVLADDEVKNALKDWLVIRIDLTERNERSQRLESYFNVIAPPTMLFYNQAGVEKDNKRITGEISKDAFLKHLKDIE